MLTTAQLQTLKADIAANNNTIPAGQPWSGSFAGTAVKLVPNTGDGNAAVAGWYNLTAATDFWVWRSSVSKDELVGSTSVDGTVFSWTGAGYITRAQGERDAFTAIFSSAGAVNPSLANVRQAFADIFSGSTAPAPANRTHLLTVARRKASNAEKLFATGTGSTASPAVMGFEGTITGDDVQNAQPVRN
jgi:hypothetical protein